MRKPLTVIAFGAHPDDVEIYMLGTLMKYQAEGCNVYYVVATYGEKGSNYTNSDKSLKEIRINEALAAASYIGVEPIFLGFNDGGIIYDQESYVKVQSIIEKIKPDVVITHYTHDYHGDHRKLSQIVLDAAGPIPVFFCDTAMGIGFEPLYYVDITPYMKKKTQAILEHTSQISIKNIDLLNEYLEVQPRFRGAQCGDINIKYAEAYCIYPRVKWLRAYDLLPI